MLLTATSGKSLTKPGNWGNKHMIFSRFTKWLSYWPDLLKFLPLALITLVVTYNTNAPVRTVWYLILLLLYYFSDNEALWLAFFLSTTDGFMGFFGLFSATMTILPGLPAVELAQIYILLSVIKALKSKVRVMIFYNKYMQILLLYLIFLIIWGQLMGFTGGLNVYFRVLKGVIPMLLFYSIPRLFVAQSTYDRFFRLIFLITILAFTAQIFTLMTGLSPLEVTGRGEETVDDTGEFRVFFNASSTLIGLFAALYYLNINKDKAPDRLFLFSMIIVAMGMAILSATRGWIISFSLIITLTIIFTGMIRSKRIIEFAVFAVPLLFWAITNPTINRQIAFASERLGKIESIAEGDLTAGGTLQRLDYRSARVLEAWKENPIFGWGLSDKGYEYGDGHVGNQSLLAMSGVVGFVLLNGFLIYFAYKMFYAYQISGKNNRDRNSLRVIVFFLAGWFIIHSSSGQQFNYVGMPATIIPQAIFFSFGAFQYEQTLRARYGKKV